jgi:DNA-binding IclR family transcriptional regulator
MASLRDRTGESVQLYVRDGDVRVCVAALESPHGLRTIVPVGAALPMDVGSAGRILNGERARPGWLQTVGEREPGVASVSAPVHGSGGEVIAAVSVSGPIDRMGRAPGRRHGAAVVEAASTIGQVVAG